ncbi:hypothetical protein RIF23_01760 [Lipingzhangella sp. LS1_29]|uniref:Uncharacterized protein n=1 Tax=Lipingzhangella rawalii TaxID=2055835 RepID=A0ABU2H2H3_9ACTN|nr:hypothetical protein [Lipingzhangella rawalii]MDS1269015.1 hypothetical protein [Lipingzhangella rawalii]
MRDTFDRAALRDLAATYAPRTVRPLELWEASGMLLKAYALTASGDEVDEALVERAHDLTVAQTRTDVAVGALGLGTVIVHRGADGDYVVLLNWVEGFMSRTTIFVGPRGQPARLRPAPAGLSPCVWELAVLGHERAAFRRLLQAADQEAGIMVWRDDTVEGEV